MTDAGEIVCSQTDADPGGHVTSHLWRQLQEHRLTPESVIYLLAQHVKDLCPRCAEEIMARYQEDEPDADGPRLALLEENLTEAIPRAGDQVREAAELVERLKGLPRSDRHSALRRDPNARGPAVVSALIREAQGHGTADASAAYAWAELAVLAAGLSDLEETDWGVLASAHLANALRALGDLEGAEERFAPVLAYLDQAPAADPMIASDVGCLYGSLLIDLGRFGDALEVLDRAVADAKSVEDSTRTAQALAKTALVHDHLERPELAVVFARQALSQVHPNNPPSRAITFHLIHYLLEAGEVGEAWERYIERLPDFPDAWQPRLLWFEGAVAAAEGDPEAAETALLEVRRHYGKTGSPFDVVLVCLDLAKLYREADREGEIPETIGYALESLAAAPGHAPTHLVNGLRQLHAAALEDRIEVSTIRELRRYVKTLRTRPFDPAAPS